jgi:hypothetical protein
MINVNRGLIKWTGRAIVALAFCIGGLFTHGLYAQTVAAANQPDAATTKDSSAPVKKSSMPAMSAFRNVSIGMPADKVKESWGKAKIEDKDGFLFELSDSETAQVRIGPDGKVMTIAVTFAGGKGAPTLTEVFGEGAAADSSQNGTVYKMVRYPDAGYWVSYFVGSGENAITTLTIQKL